MLFCSSQKTQTSLPRVGLLAREVQPIAAGRLTFPGLTAKWLNEAAFPHFTVAEPRRNFTGFPFMSVRTPEELRL